MSGPLIDLPHGTQVTLRIDSTKHQKGAAGVVEDDSGPERYWVGFPDGIRENLHRNNLTVLRLHQKDVFDPDPDAEQYRANIIYLAQSGSKAYGLATESSDDDLYGVYLAPLYRLLSLRGVLNALDLSDPDMKVWQLRKFVHMALNANPNVMECLFSPQVMVRKDLFEPVLYNRDLFLSKRIYVTYQGYVMSQMKKLEQDLRANGHIRWKHAMQTGEVLVDVAPIGPHIRDRLLEVRHGELPWDQVDRWRKSLHLRFEEAFSASSLPEYPDYERADDVLLEIRIAQAEQWLDGGEHFA